MWVALGLNDIKRQKNWKSPACIKQIGKGFCLKTCTWRNSINRRTFKTTQPSREEEEELKKNPQIHRAQHSPLNSEVRTAEGKQKGNEEKANNL